MKSEYLLDIIFCILVLPGMMFLFPLGEWMQWRAGYVLLYIVWLYGCAALCRGVLGPAALSGKRGVWTAVIALFLMTAVTALMSIARVDFPKDMEQVSGLELHQRAVWILFLATVSYSFSSGVLSTKIDRLLSVRTDTEKADAVRTTLERVASEAVAGETVSLKVDYKTIQVPLSEIRYIESRNNYACLHLDNREDVVSQVTLKALLEMLPEGKFIRIHRSYIVPAYRIEKSTSTSVKLLGVEDPLPVGRAHKENLK